MTPDAAAWTAILLSLRVAVVATVCSLPIAVWVAWLLARRKFPGHGLLNLLQRSLSSLRRDLSPICRSLSSLRCCRCVTGTACGQRQRSAASCKAVA